jgi:dTDP-4-amino-4,6-dideoxygalactose transaminase
MMFVAFNRPYVTGREFSYIQQAIDAARLSGNGPFAMRCQGWLERATGARKALLVHSCTGALEMSALLTAVGPGDEVIMPSFTFVSTANAFVLRGAVPVFVDIRPDTLNIDETKIEEAITDRTRAIVVVHYAGVGCEMDAISRIAEAHGLVVIEDAAQCIQASYRGRPLGGIGDLGTLSFHETKNIQCGEGGALLVNRERWIERAEVLQEKGTDRSRFFRGQVDKYSWVDVGSSYLLSDMAAAFLWAQLESVDEITARRMRIWDRYHSAFADIEAHEVARRPFVPAHCQHNAHLYYLLVRDLETRTRVLRELNAVGVNAVFHYVPLHSASAGRTFGRAVGELANTDRLSERLIRLPLWAGMAESEVDHVISSVVESLQVVRVGR